MGTFGNRHLTCNNSDTQRIMFRHYSTLFIDSFIMVVVGNRWFSILENREYRE